MNHKKNLKWRTDLEKSVIVENLEEKGFQRC